MIKFYYHPTPNPAKVALFLEEAALDYELMPVDTSKGEQHQAWFRAINPNGKVPAIVDRDGPAGTPVRIFDSTAILIYLAEKTGTFLGAPEDKAELLSWLMFIATGLGPFSGQAVHFQRNVVEKIPYAINRYRREAERHYRLLDERLRERRFLVGEHYTIADMSAWGWVQRARFVFPDLADPLGAFPGLRQWMDSIDARPAAARARQVGSDIAFKREVDEETLRSLFPSNYPDQ